MLRCFVTAGLLGLFGLRKVAATISGNVIVHPAPNYGAADSCGGTVVARRQSDPSRYRICPLHRAPGDTKGQQMGHQSAKMGHRGTPTDTILTSVDVMVKRKARRWVSTGFLGAERPKNQVWVAEAAPMPFCDFRRLWYTPTYKFSAQQAWRHGVRSRSLGGMCRHLP